LLRPQPEQRSLAEFIEYTKSWERPAGLEPKAEFNSPWSGSSAPPSHSLPAAIAGKTAATFGQEAWRRYHNKLLRAYFIENRDVSSSGVLLEVANETDIDADAFEEIGMANKEDFEKQVFAEYNEAVSSGINGVPAVVIDNRFLISGAVEVEQYQKALAHYREIRDKENNN
jgi:predicted DsbA family dithiol-disulfide isomerase